MKHVKRLRFDQQKMLRAIRDGDVLLPELLRTFNIDATRLARWLRRRYFREALTGMLAEKRQQTWLALELLHAAALSTVRAMLKDEITRDELLMNNCQVALEEYDRAYRRRRQRIADQRRNKGKKSKSPYDFERDLCHPSAKHQEQELLAILEEPD